MRWDICRTLLLRNSSVFKIAPTVRNIHKTSYRNNEDDDENSKPLKFSTSKGSHRTWTVAKSMGSDHQRPLWKVLPVTFAIIGFLLWCVFREETEIDKMLFNPIIESSEKAEDEIQPDKTEDR